MACTIQSAFATGRPLGLTVASPTASAARRHEFATMCVVQTLPSLSTMSWLTEKRPPPSCSCFLNTASCFSRMPRSTKVTACRANAARGTCGDTADDAARGDAAQGDAARGNAARDACGGATG